MPSIEIYSKPGCNYCNAARAFLRNKGVAYSEHVLGKNFTREWLLEQFPQAKTFPIIVVDGYNIGGFAELKEQVEKTVQTGSSQFLTE